MTVRGLLREEFQRAFHASVAQPDDLDYATRSREQRNSSQSTALIQRRADAAHPQRSLKSLAWAVVVRSSCEADILGERKPETVAGSQPQGSTWPTNACNLYPNAAFNSPSVNRSCLLRTLKEIGDTYEFDLPNSAIVTSDGKPIFKLVTLLSVAVLTRRDMPLPVATKVLHRCEQLMQISYLSPLTAATAPAYLLDVKETCVEICTSCHDHNAENSRHAQLIQCLTCAGTGVSVEGGEFENLICERCGGKQIEPSQRLCTTCDDYGYLRRCFKDETTHSSSIIEEQRKVYVDPSSLQATPNPRSEVFLEYFNFDFTDAICVSMKLSSLFFEAVEGRKNVSKTVGKLKEASVAQDNVNIDRYWRRIQKLEHEVTAIETQHWETEILPLQAEHQAIAVRCIALIEEDIASYKRSLASLGVVVCGTLAQTLVQLKPESSEACALKKLTLLSDCLQVAPDRLQTSRQDEELIVSSDPFPQEIRFDLGNYLGRLSQDWKGVKLVESWDFDSGRWKIGIVKLLNTVPHSDSGAS